MGDQQSNQRDSKSAPSNSTGKDAASEKPKTGDEGSTSDTPADSESGSGARRGSLSNPSNPYDETRGADQGRAEKPDSKGG